jgi:hypothetical protein
MATQLQIVNRILIRLRESTVASVSLSDYAQLIASFINEAKEDIEDAWFWTVNETEIDTSILADGTRDYDLTTTTDRSFLVRSLDDNVPMAYDITASEEGQLFDIPLKELRRWRNTFKGTPDDLEAPIEFAIKTDADGRGYTLELKQGSTTARTWRTYWYAPQATLEVDGTDDNTEILLPERPIYLAALMYALNERGEEMGEPAQMVASQAERAVAAAMELDMQVNKKSDEKDMTNLEALRTDLIGVNW